MDGLTCTCIGSRFAHRSIQEGVGGVLADSRIECNVVGGVNVDGQCQCRVAALRGRAVVGDVDSARLGEGLAVNPRSSV